MSNHIKENGCMASAFLVGVSHAHEKCDKKERHADPATESSALSFRTKKTVVTRR